MALPPPVDVIVSTRAGSPEHALIPSERTDNAPPFVSVVVPTRGRVALVGRLLASLQALDWPADRYEIIVVHNYTPDGTEELVQALVASSRVPMSYHRTNFKGQAASRQFGVERARGSVIAFTDDDCEVTPGWLAAGVAALAQGFALVQGRTIPRPDQPRRLLEKTISIEAATPFFETCNIFYDTAVFRAVGGFPPDFLEAPSGMDTALGWRVVAAGHRAGFTADALVMHEVFTVTFVEWLRAVSIPAYMPYIVRACPGLRAHLFLGVFLSPLTASFDLFALGLLGGVLASPWLLLLCLPYVALRCVDRGRFRAPHVLLARLVFGLPRAALLAAELLTNSLRARTLVL